ncbi:unnamed protein product [Heterobilharzia americana]|nr:unnamed protein product [Heterobilharzia americana]
MDTSMEDLFSDFDKSTVLVDPDDTDKRGLTVLTTETLGSETIKIEGLYQPATQSFDLTIELYRNSLSAGCVNLEIPYHHHHLTSNTGGSDLKISSIHICVLCDKSCYMNMLSYLQQHTSSVFADFSSLSISSSIFACSRRFLNILCDITEEDSELSPDLIRLCSLPNGMVYAIWYSPVTKQVHCSVAFLFSCFKLIVTWAFIRNPAITTMSHTSTNSFVNIPSLQTESNTVNDLLVGLSEDGEGVGVWFDSSQSGCEKKILNTVEFNLPKPPDRIVKCRAQGSWLHVTTQSGHLMSIHFSLQLRTSEDFDSVLLTKWNLVCQPANFPRLPVHLAPIDSVEQWIKSCPKWRNLKVYDFTRLADGHLGGIDSLGCKTRLIDLLTKAENLPEVGNVDSAETKEQELNQTFINLVKTEHQLKIYLACLYLMHHLTSGDPETCKASRSLLNCNVYLIRSTEFQSQNLSPLELVVDISAQDKITDNNVGDADNLFNADWNKCNRENLARIILFESSEGNQNRFISESLQRYLYAVVTVEIVKRDCELSASTSSSSNVLESTMGVDDDTFNHSLIYTHKEPWFSGSSNVDSSKIRRFNLPSDWLQIFCTFTSSSSIAKSFFAGDYSSVIQVNIQLEFQPPMLPYICFEQFNQKIFHSREQFDSSPILVTIGCRLFDWIHILCEMKTSSMLESSMEPMKTYPVMHFNTNDSVLKSILSDALKIPSSQNNQEDCLESIIKSRYCLFYNCLTKQSIRLQWSPYLDINNLGNNVEKKSSCHGNSTTWCCTISSNCSITLWSTFKAIELRQQIAQKNNLTETVKPSVEQLRLECCVLKKLLTSLHNLRLDTNNNNVQLDLSSEPNSVVNFLLDSFCIIRKTASSCLLNNNKVFS